jgi:glycosyltransferase involved in cell wall biosynthesis
MTRAHQGVEISGSRPKVAMVVHRVDDSGGMERVHAELVRRLIDRYRFVIVASNVADDLRERIDWKRVPFPSLPIPLSVLVFYIFGAFRLRRVHADLVHVCGALVPCRADIASVHFCHAGFVASSGRFAPQHAPFARRLNTSLHRHLAIGAERRAYRQDRLRMLAPVSHQVAEELNNAYPGVAIEEAPNGVDLDRFRPDPAVRTTLRSELNTDDSSTVALFVGSDWDRKGLALAIEALAVARAAGSGVELWVLGSGDERRFRIKAENAGVARALRFLGRRSDAERYYQAADVYLCCSSYEAFSLALLEASACALPFVATKVGGVAEVVDGSGEPGGVVVERRAQELGKALSEFARDPALRRRKGEAARRRAEEFGWDRLAERFDALYRQLLLEAGR